MTTVSEVLNHLKEEGYTVDFNLRGDCLMGPGDALQLYPDEGQTTELKPGQLLTLQSGLPHRVVARQASVFLLTMANPALVRPVA